MASHPWLSRRSTDWSSATWETPTSDRRSSLVLILGQLRRKQTLIPGNPSSCMDLILGQGKDRTTKGRQQRRARLLLLRQQESARITSLLGVGMEKLGRQGGWIKAQRCCLGVESGEVGRAGMG